MERLLVIDDDIELCELVLEYLEPQGFEIQTAQDGERGVDLATSEAYSLIVLDVMLPGIDGFEVLRRIRAKTSAPVLMLTGRGDDIDRIVGLEMGADDYLAKPFNPRELVARIRAVLRRSKGMFEEASGQERPPTLVVDDIELDPGSRTVWLRGQEVALTTAEFDLLHRLLRSAGQSVGREELFESVLQRKLVPLDRTIDMHVSNLRKKLGPSQAGGERIKSVRGVGYLYTTPARQDATR